MKERPINFNDEMVRAILEGRKTQTRRIVNPQPKVIHALHGDASITTNQIFRRGDNRVHCPSGQVGDRLWVRECFGACNSYVPHIFYRADGEAPNPEFKWKPSIHMPRRASRITLEITSVRVERLQDISEDDAQAEGLEALTKDGGRTVKYGIPDRDGLPGDDDIGWSWCDWSYDPREAFAKLWSLINGPDSWDSNPWVWVIEFKQVTP